MLKKTSRPFRFSLALAALVLACAPPSFAAPAAISQLSSVSAASLGASSFRPGLHLNQVINLANEVLFTAKVGEVSSTESFGLNTNVTSVQGAAIAVLPRVSVSNGMSRQAAQQKVNEWFDYVPNSFTRSMGNWLKERGISQGFFSFSQEVTLQTDLGLRKQVIAWTGFVDSTGKGTYGAPRIIDPDPTFVEAQYANRRVDSMLPSGWRYQEGGKLRYRVLDMKGREVLAWRTIDTGGAFDEDESDMGDDSRGVRCLVDRANVSGCPTTTNLRDIMQSTGSASAVLRYVRQLQPVFVESTDPKAGPDEFDPVRVYTYEDRLMTCDILQNKGQFGYLLEASSTIYAVNENAPRYLHQRIADEAIKAISPVDPFDHTVPIAAIGSMHPAEALISPFDGSTIWHIDSREGKAALSIAPIRTEISGKTNVSGTAGGAEVSVNDLGSGLKEFKIGKPFWCPGIDGACNSMWGGLYHLTASFSLEEVDRIEEFTLVQSEFDDRAMIEVNGYLMYIGPDGYSLAANKGWAVGETGFSLGSGTFYEFSCESGESSGCYARRVQAVYFGKITGAGIPGQCGAVPYVEGIVPCWDWLTRGVAVDGYRDLKRKFYVTHNIDLRPWLKEGVNTIRMSLIVADTGGGAVTIRERRKPGCGEKFGIDEANPPPLGGSINGVIEELEYLGNYR